MGPPDATRYVPRLIAWEVSRFCLLSCKHCRGAAQATTYSGELTTGECFKLLDNIASFAKPIIILTGGEPMLRPDIYDIAAYGHGLGLRVVMAPCGILINDETAARIVQSGIQHISISLDGATAESHDSFRGVNGAFEGTILGIEAAKRAGLIFQINTTVSRHNLDELPAILELAVELGADVFNPFLLVPTGRGKQLTHLEIPPEQYEKTLHWFAEQRNRPDIKIRVTCAPHYQRILRQHGDPGARGPHAATGCMGGKSFAFVSHRGKVQICGFLDVECGDLREEDLDFQKIWTTSHVLRRVRDVDSYRGRCGYCEFRTVCGGCRARAYALTGDYLAEEPYCVYQPRRSPSSVGVGAVIEMDALDRRLLSIIQSEFPVAERPFDALADRMGIEPDSILARIARLRAGGMIRRLGPVLDSRRLGYASTLVAARIPKDRLDEVAALVSELPGVTHNYRREHLYDLWFTLTAESPETVERHIERLRRQTGIEEFHNLPALTVYKTRVNFRLSDDVPEPDVSPAVPSAAAVALDESQKALIRLLQDDLPLVREPFAEMAARLGWPVERVIGQIRDWLAEGVIRRFGAVVGHRHLGFVANGMAVFRVPPERIDEAGRRLARHPQVSHCYRRPSLPHWDYSLFAMVHGKSVGEVQEFVLGVAQELNLPEHEILFSTTEYKKTSMRYFVEAPLP